MLIGIASFYWLRNRYVADQIVDVHSDFSRILFTMGFPLENHFYIAEVGFARIELDQNFICHEK